MAIKYIFASSSHGTVIKNLWKIIPNSFYGILTDRDCGAKKFAFENDIPHFDFQEWKKIPTEIPIFLIGFKKILSEDYLINNKVYNIHPSLLPLHSGWNENVHLSVLKSGQKITGVTIHEVNKTIDGGKILWQFPIPVLENDSVESLKNRCQKVETYMCNEFLKNKQSNLWWDLCVESLGL